MSDPKTNLRVKRHRLRKKMGCLPVPKDVIGWIPAWTEDADGKLIGLPTVRLMTLSGFIDLKFGNDIAREGNVVPLFKGKK